jgi:hypothetical protein
MVKAAEGLKRTMPTYKLANRVLRPDRRTVPRNDYVLYDGYGRKIGWVISVPETPCFGSEAPAVLLQREF